VLAVPKFVAVMCAALFTGAALYMSVVEQPARLLANMEVALGEFRPGFPRARALQASLAVAGALSAGWVWWQARERAWLLALLCFLSIVIFTLVVIMPIYTALLAPSLSASDPEAQILLVRWGHLHAVRTVLGLVALISLVFSLMRAEGHG
jgi:hypothetical protein